jgi:hypothetical protein
MFTFLKAVWAELKNQRVIFLSGITVAVLLYAFFPLGPWRNSNFGPLAKLVLILSFFAFASFACSLALRRTNVECRVSAANFLIKLFVAVFAIFISSILVGIALALSLPQGNPYNSFLDSIYPDFEYIQPQTYLSGAFLICACTITFSLLLSRRWLSALVGFVLGTAILFSTVSFWIRLDFSTRMDRKPIDPIVLLIGSLLLVFSWIMSGRVNSFRSSMRFVLGSFAIIVIAFCTSAAMLAIRPHKALVMGAPGLSPDGTVVVSNAYSEFARQVWLQPTDLGAGNRTIKKHAYDPTFSPDGRWFAFFSQMDCFGLRSFDVDLLIAKTDGTEEKTILPNFSRWHSEESGMGHCGKAFSPDSKHIALLGMRMIYVLDLEGNIKSRAEVSPRFLSLLGWSPTGLEVLLLDYDRYSIGAYDISKKQLRTVYQADHYFDPLAVRVLPGVGVRHVLLGSELIDIEKGSSQVLLTNVKYASADISADLSILFYTVKSAVVRAENSSTQIHRRFLKTGRDELCGEFKGSAGRIFISPDGSKAAIELCTGVLQFQTVVLYGNAVVRRFEGWGLVGWRDSKRAVLADNSTFPKRMALADIETGIISQFYP